MTPRNLSSVEIETIAREIFRKEMANAQLVGADGIKLIALDVFRKEIQPTHADIEEIKQRLGEFSERLDGVTGTLTETQQMIKRLHSFGQGAPGWFEVRAKEDDEWREKISDYIQRWGIVDEAKKIVAAEKEQRIARYEKYSKIMWPVIGGLAGVVWASVWKVIQNASHSGVIMIPHWFQHLVDVFAK